MARTGGVCTFIMIGLLVLGFLLSLVAQNQPVIGIVVLVLYLAAFVLWIVAMIAIKVNCSQNGYPYAGGPVLMILILTVLMVVVGIVGVVVVGTQFGRTGAAPTNPQDVLRAFGIWGVILGVAGMLMQIFYLVLGIRLNAYGSMGNGVWKGAGIVLIITACVGLLILLLYVATVLTQAWGILIVAGILGLIDLILLLVVWILIGIGFMGDAKRMAEAAPVAVHRR